MLLLLLILLVLVGMALWFGFQDVPAAQTEVEQEVSADALGL
ncbi:hypothetical protein [Pacificimonas pallii]|nr:hypothetical protein [Pacificimonas pallii]